jgi:hypothetical protein
LFPAQTSSEGDLSPVYRRANLSRTFGLVVALLLAAVSTGAFARGFPIQAPQGPSGAEQEQTGTGAAPLDRTIVALIGTSAPLLVWRHCRTERI